MLPTSCLRIAWVGRFLATAANTTPTLRRRCPANRAEKRLQPPTAETPMQSNPTLSQSPSTPTQSRGDFMETRTLGRYIVADPDICHGEPTFRGTRIMVADVLEQVESGMVWEAIVEEWRGTLTRAAIAEAVRMAREALDGIAIPSAYLKFKFFSWGGFN